jgi:replicative DNA helicase
MLQPLEEAKRRPRRPPTIPNTTRVPPHNLEAEESLLGAMLLSHDAIAIGIEKCTRVDFYKPSHALIFDSIETLFGRAEPADAVSVAEELRRRGVLEEIGGAAVLATLQSTTAAISSTPRYAKIVVENALLRRLIGVAQEISEIGYSLPENVPDAIDNAEQMVYEVARHQATETVEPINDLLGRTLDELERLYERGESITGVATGYHDLDEKLSGLQPSNLVIVGARPSMGKTAFALGLAAHAAMQGTPVLFFSLEMGHLEIAQRVLCAEAQVDQTRLRNGKLREADWRKISNAIGRIGASKLYIDDNPNTTVMDMRAKARRMRSRDGLGLVVVDYLQLMRSPSSAENRQVEISEISRGLKILARELKIPVVALSQLSRALETRSDKRPVLADLRESGAIEQDADVVLFINREEVYNPDTPEKGTAQIAIAKHRNGPVGQVMLSFIPEHARFGNLARV